MSTNLVTDTQLSLQEQTFALSMLSNIFDMSMLSNESAARQQLQNLIDKYVNARAANGENWVVDWGPVGKADSTNTDVPDNVLYVAQNTATGTDYVIATAGTLAGAHYAVFDEDAKSALTTFQATGSKSFTITEGTIDGLNILLALQDANGQYLVGTSATDGYLHSITSGASSINVTFTGHSLGGALSPALALTAYYMRTGQGSTSGISQGNWDSRGVATISFLETAGAAVGDQDYVHQLAAACPDSAAVWNCIDIVPHAWWNLRSDSGLCNSSGQTNVKNIKEIYKPYTSDPNYEASGRLAGVIDLAFLKQTAAHVPINATPSFAGPFQEITIPGSCNLNSNIYYAGEVIHQHIDAYLNYFNCSDLLEVLTRGGGSTLPLACKLLQLFYSSTDCSCLS